MPIFYKDGFYQDESAPEGAVSVNEDDYISLLEGQAQGKQIMPNTKGYPILVEPRPSKYHTWNGMKWILPKSQQQAVISAEKSAKREEINRKRDEVCFGGIYIDVLDKWFDTDQTSFVKMIGAKAVMDDDFSNGQEIQPELWICADNSVVQLNRDDLALIIRSIKQNVSAMHVVAVQHKMSLEQVENPLEYDYSGGWSKTYQEFLDEQTQ